MIQSPKLKSKKLTPRAKFSKFSDPSHQSDNRILSPRKFLFHRNLSRILRDTGKHNESPSYPRRHFPEHISDLDCSGHRAPK